MMCVSDVMVRRDTHNLWFELVQHGIADLLNDIRCKCDLKCPFPWYGAALASHICAETVGGNNMPYFDAEAKFERREPCLLRALLAKIPALASFHLLANYLRRIYYVALCAVRIMRLMFLKKGFGNLFFFTACRPWSKVACGVPKYSGR